MYPDMGDWRKNGNWVPSALAMAFGLLWFLLASHQSLFCADEAGLVCAREWISATSGYVAAVFAAITIGFLYRQNAEQKKQTQFLLGDARPTIDAILHQKSEFTAVIRVVNWNRRPILVTRVAVKVPKINVEVQLSEVRLFSREHSGDFVTRQINNGTISPAIAMHGWKDRSVAPCEVRVDIWARKVDGLYLVDWAEAIVELGVVMAGEERSHLLLTSPVAVAD